MKLKINRQNYLLYLVVFTLILLLFFYLLSDKDAIVRQLYKEFYGASAPTIREGIDAEGLDWAIYDGYNEAPFLAEAASIPSMFSGRGAYDLSTLAAMTKRVDIDNQGLHKYTIILKGYFKPSVSGVWNFRTSSDDASYLWLGMPALSQPWKADTSLIDNGGLHGNRTIGSKYQVSLDSSTYYPIRIQMAENYGLYTLKFEHLSPAPGSNWSSNFAGLLVSTATATQYAPQSGLEWRTYNGYFGNDKKNGQENVWFSSSYKLTGGPGKAVNTSSLSAITNGKIKENINIQDNGISSLPTGYTSGSGTNDHNFSMELVGYFYTNTASTDPNQVWNFFLYSDDASYMWIDNIASYNTNNATIKNGGLHGMNLATGSAKLLPNKYYPIRIVYGENQGGFNLRFGWQPPSGTWTSNGSLYLYSENYSEIPNNNTYTGYEGAKI